MYLAELDSVTSYCFRSLDGSNYDVRCDVAKLLGHVLACSLDPPKYAISKHVIKPEILNKYRVCNENHWHYCLLYFSAAKTKLLKLDDVFNILGTGFLKGGGGSFLKGSSAGEMIKGSGSVNREIRVGVTHVSVWYYMQARRSPASCYHCFSVWFDFFSTFFA